jgi:hypothetical protein
MLLQVDGKSGPTTEKIAIALGAGVTEVGGEKYMRDAGGRLVPIAVVKPEHSIEDQTVRTIVAFAEDLSAQIARFRGHTFDDVATFIELLSEKYGGARGGRKGNVTLTSYDGLLKVQVQVQDQLTFGPELQIAKGLVDGCITSWSVDTRPEIRALVQHAFQVDKEGRINRAALFALRRLDIDDAQWRSAMTAIGDAIRVIGSKQYVRFYRRATRDAAWQPITIDLAQAVS